MSEDRRRRAAEIVQSLLERPVSERTGLLRDACKDDPTLIPEVESLLDSFDRVGGLLKESKSQSVAQVEGGDRSDAHPENEGGVLEKIGKYEVLGRIGQGAMGVVYKGRDPKMGRLVAIKTMSAEIASEVELHDRFYTEARSAGTLSHKNIITIYEFDEDERRRPFIAMEFLVGEDLRTKLDRGSKMTLETRVSWMRDMTEGLAHAHGKEIIHRDIKPANLFITRSGELKILDFGLARLTSSVATKTGLVMGTPSYMSPEQVRGETVDHRSDIFSAGATFYELLTNTKPFESESLHGVFFRILETTPRPLTEFNPWLPDDFVQVLGKAMAKNREHRYQDVAELSRDLEKIERTIGAKKRSLRADLLEALDLVEQLSIKQASLAVREGLSVQEGGDETVTLSTSVHDATDSPTLNFELPADYLGLADMLGRVRDDEKRLLVRIEHLERAGRLLSTAAGLEEQGKLSESVETADRILLELPRHPIANALVDRVSRKLAQESTSWREARIGQLLNDVREHMSAGLDAACESRIERLEKLDPARSDIADFENQLRALREKNRAASNRHKTADGLIADAKSKLEEGDNPHACLEMLDQAAALRTDMSVCVDLYERAERRLSEQQEAASEKTAAEAVVAATRAMAAGDLKRADAELFRAQSQYPEHQSIPGLFDELEQAKRAQGLFESGTDALERGDFETCISRMDEVLALSPDHSQATAVHERAESLARLPDASRPVSVESEASPRPRRVAPRPSTSAPVATTPTWMKLAVAFTAVAGAVILARTMLEEPSAERTTASRVPVSSESTTSSVSATPSVVSVPTTTIAVSTSIEPASTVPSTSVAPTTSVTAVTSVVPTTSVAPTTSAPVSTSTMVTSSVTTSIEATVSARDQILALMRQYQAAYEGLDVSALGGVYPQVPVEVKNSFQNFKSLSLDMEAIEPPTISSATAGRTAQAVYRIVQTIEPKIGKRVQTRHQATFQFAGLGDAWIITQVVWKRE